MVSTRPRKVFDRSLACWISLAIATVLARTWLTAGVSAPAAIAGRPAPTSPLIIRPSIRCRVVLLMAFPPPDGSEAAGTAECGEPVLGGEHRQKRSRNGRLA